MLRSIAVAACLPLLALGQQLPEKPGVGRFSADFAGMMPALDERPLPTYTLKSWEVSADTTTYIPAGQKWDELFAYPTTRGDICANATIGNGYQVYNVTFSDCPSKPWIFGYCEKLNAGLSDTHETLDQAITTISKIPAPLRALVGSFIYGGNHYTHNSDKRSGTNSANSVLFAGSDIYRREGWTSVSLLRFATVFLSADDSYWKSAPYLDALAADTCVVQKDIGRDPGQVFYSSAAIAAYEVWTGKKFTGMDVECMRKTLEQIKKDFDFKTKYGLNAQCDAEEKAAPLSVPYSKGSGPAKYVGLPIPKPLNNGTWETDTGAAANALFQPPREIVKTVEWPAGVAPAACYGLGKDWKKGDDKKPYCAPKDWRVVNVTYSDCDERPFTYCVCSDTEHMADSYIQGFSRLPIAARSILSYVELFHVPGATVLYALQREGAVAALTVQAPLNALAHEIGHLLDWHGRNTNPGTLSYSETEEFKAARALDEVKYPKPGSNIEEFAQLVMIQLMRNHGWEEPGMVVYENQLKYVETQLGKYLQPQKEGETCDTVMRNAYPIELVHFDPATGEKLTRRDTTTSSLAVTRQGRSVSSPKPVVLPGSDLVTWVGRRR